MKKTLRADLYGDQLRLVVTYEHGHYCPKKWTEKLIGQTDYQFENFPPLAQGGCFEYNGEIYDKEGEKDYERLSNNIARARSRVRELALCNDWEYFVTLTLDKGRQDRFDLAAYVRSLGVWIGNYNKRYGTHLRYLIIPEQHKNGAWHAHGLFAGVAAASLQVNQFGYLDLPYYAARFGYISLSAIKDKVACAAYITKYITKGLHHTAFSKGQRMFYYSRGLQGRKTLFECTVTQDFLSAWSNDWCGITWGKFGGSVDELSHIRREIEKGRNPYLNGYEYETREERKETAIALAHWRLWHELPVSGKGNATNE